MIEPFSENYLKKLIGNNDIEGALKRLDRLTEEEARMASAQALKITNAVDDKVAGIEDNMRIIDYRVAGVDERVAGVDDRMDVNDLVRVVDGKVAAVIDGARYICYLSS